ncbi:50S ribosomal protein L29 [bacterium]|nr:50S ribosomal protein L29 [bacterium]
MKMEKIREMTGEEMEQSLREIKEELFNLRFQMSNGQAGNPLRIRELRRSIARIKTRQRDLVLNKRAETAIH